MRQRLIEEKLTQSVIGAFFEVYNTLGFGFLEQVYVQSLSRELLQRGHSVAHEVQVPVNYKGEVVAFQRIDLIVNDKLVVETKSTYELHRAAPRQLFNYLRSTGLEVGLLLHFGPSAKFHRLISRPTRDNPMNPDAPLNPVTRSPILSKMPREQPTP